MQRVRKSVRCLWRMAAVFAAGWVALCSHGQALDMAELKALLPKKSPGLDDMQRELSELKAHDKPGDKDMAHELRSQIKDLEHEIREREKEYAKKLSDCKAMIARLEKGKEDIHKATDAKKRTLIMLVAALGYDPATELVLQDNPPMGTPDAGGKVAYDYEREAGGMAVEKYLRQRWEKAMVQLSMEEIVDLIESGAGPEWITGDPGMYPLSTAALNERDDLVMLLMAYQARANISTLDVKSPLEVAVEAGHPEVFRSLLSAEVDLQTRMSDKMTFMDHLLRPGKEELLAVVCSSVSSPKSGAAPLCLAVRLGSPHAVQLCAEVCKEQMNNEDAMGNMPLLEAARRGNVEIFRMLISAGASMEERNSLGETVLMHAALSGSPEMLATVLQNLPRRLCMAEDKKKRNALFYARLAKDEEAQKTLKSAGLK